MNSKLLPRESHTTELLSSEYHLIATNVPYLGYKKQASVLREFGEGAYQAGKADLATMFIQRTIQLSAPKGCVALVCPRYWLFLHSYTDLRKWILSTYPIKQLAFLGPNSFETIGGEVVNVCLLTVEKDRLDARNTIWSVDVTDKNSPTMKDTGLRVEKPSPLGQMALLANPDHRITAEELEVIDLVGKYAIAPRGVVNGDIDKWTRFFWEVDYSDKRWKRLQNAVMATEPYGGRERVIDWSTSGKGMLRPGLGNPAYTRLGVAISRMSNLPVTLYTGELYDQNTAVLVPHKSEHLAALWAFCSSSEFTNAVRVLDQKLGVTPATLLKVGFDLERWGTIAKETFPGGLPKPFSNSPTQWLFNGAVVSSSAPLQVAVARFLGYHWPDQAKESDFPEKLADKNGIVCMPSVRGEKPASERLLEALYATYGKKWSNVVLHGLLTEGDYQPSVTLDDWLCNYFFEQHCKLFYHRPFIWHIWDGRKDGFSCLVNYHKLNHKTLENLTYSYLGDWIKAQTADTRAGKVGADLRLAAAQALQEKLKLILAGEPPYDIFARWKTLSEQAIGWNPDLNDGVRMNIRPFVEAGILRKTPNIKWAKDRGKEPERDRDEFPWLWKGKEFGGDRVNDVHLTNTEKQAVRSKI